MARGPRSKRNSAGSATPAPEAPNVVRLVPPREPRRPRSLATAPSAATDIAALRPDANDEVLRVLSDFDFDPTRTTVAEVEARIGDPAAASVESGLDHMASDDGSEISDILAVLVDDAANEDLANPAPSDRSMSLGRQMIRRLEVAIGRGRHYLEGTSGLAALSPYDAQRSTALAHAMVGYLAGLGGAAPDGGVGEPGSIERSIAGIAGQLVPGMMAMLPPDLDLEPPDIGFPAYDLKRVVYALQVSPERERFVELCATLDETTVAIVGRNARVEAARAAWQAAVDLLGTIERIRSAPPGRA